VNFSVALNNALCDIVLSFAQYWTFTCGLCETSQLQLSHVATSQTISRRVPSSFIFSGRHVSGKRRGLAVASLCVGFVTLGLCLLRELHQLIYGLLVTGNHERLNYWTIKSVGTHPRDLSMP